MNRKGFTQVTIVIGVVIFFGLLWFFYFLGTKNSIKSNSFPSIAKVDNNKEVIKQSCHSEMGCWFETVEGKMGYGQLKGYYMNINKSGISCDSFVPFSHDSIFYELDSRDYALDNTSVLSINLKNLSNEIQQKIKQSTKSDPVILKVVQIPTDGYGYKGCRPSTVSILDVIN